MLIENNLPGSGTKIGRIVICLLHPCMFHVAAQQCGLPRHFACQSVTELRLIMSHFMLPMISLLCGISIECTAANLAPQRFV